MNTSRLLFLPVLAVLSTVALTSFRAVDSEGRPTRDVREVPAFTRLSLSTSARVVLRQGSPQRVEVEASAADQQWLETTVDNNRLRIGTKDQVSKMRWHKFEGPVVVYITMPTVSALSVNGSGDLKAETDLTTDKLDLVLNGSGQLELPVVKASELETSVNGSGDVLLGGNCPRHQIAINGSGNVQADKLRTESASVSIHGSGDAHVFATKTLKSTLIGSGDVYTQGGAQVSASRIGSGKVHQK